MEVLGLGSDRRDGVNVHVQDDLHAEWRAKLSDARLFLRLACCRGIKIELAVGVPPELHPDSELSMVSKEYVLPWRINNDGRGGEVAGKMASPKGGRPFREKVEKPPNGFGLTRIAIAIAKEGCPKGLELFDLFVDHWRKVRLASIPVKKKCNLLDTTSTEHYYTGVPYH